MICLPGSADISGLGADTGTSRPRAEILPGMNAAALALLNAQKLSMQKPDNSLKAKIMATWKVNKAFRYSVYGIAGVAALLLGRKLLKK